MAVDGGRRRPGGVRRQPAAAGGMGPGGARCAALPARDDAVTATPTRCSASTPPAPGEDTRRALGGSAGVTVDESVTISRPISELYRFWRNLENLPRFMSHLESVERITDTLSRWRAKGPAGTDVEWNAEIINEVPDQVIGWRSIEGSDVVIAGSVNFDEVLRRHARPRPAAVQPPGRQGRRRRRAADGQ